MNLFGKSAVFAGLAAAAVATATPAQARDGWHRGGDDTAAWAVGAGIVGLAVGAAIASDHDDRYYRDRVYYRDGYRYPRYRGYYYRSYPVYRDDWRYREWREHERWEHRRDWNRGYYGRRGW